MTAELQEISKTIEKKLGTVFTSIDDLQKRQDKYESESKGSELPADVKELIDKAAKDATEALGSVNDLKNTSKAVEKSQEYIEKAIARLGESKGSDASQLTDQEQKAKEEMNGFIRFNKPISRESNEVIARGLIDHHLNLDDEDLKIAQVKTLISGNNPSGGYFFRPQLSLQMIKRIFETSPIRPIANVISTSNDSVEIVIDDNESMSGGFVGEVESREAETDTAQIGKLTIPIHEQFAQPVATQKSLIDPAFNAEGWLTNNNTDIFTRTENNAFIRSPGSQSPRGILALPDWAVQGAYERNALERRISGTNGSFEPDPLIAIQNDLKEVYQPNAVFGIKRASFTNILQLKNTQNDYLINPRIVAEGGDKVLLGKPVIFMDDLDGLSTDGQSLIYGDFSVGYTIIDRLGFNLIRDEVTKKGFVKFYTTKYVGGDVTNFEALKIMRLSA